jgi:hypothetical protein
MAIAACTTDTGPSTGNPVTINWAPCINSSDFPAWFAVQDGGGAWTKVASSNGVFTFTVNSDKAGVAAYANGLLTVVYATTAELNSTRPSCTGSRRAVTGTVTGYTALDAIDIEMDEGSASVSGATAAPAAFQLTDVAPGASDVLAVRSRTSVVGGSTIQQTPSAVFIRRAQTNSPLATLDLNSTAESGAPQSRTVTVTNMAGNEILDALSFLSTPTSSITMSTYSASLGTVSGNVAALFYGLASTRLGSGDSQELQVVATKTISASSSESRYVSTIFTDATDKSVTLLSALGTISIATAGPSASYVIQSGYDQTFELDLDQGSKSTAKSIQLLMTRAYSGATATAVTLLVPDLTSVSGFLPAWLLTTGTSARWTFFAGSYSLSTAAEAYTAGSRTATFVP